MTQIRAEEGEETSPRGEVAETFPIRREEVAKVGKVNDGGRAGFCLAGHALAGKTAGGVGGVEDEKGDENGCFQFTGRETRPFYQPNNEA